MMMGGSKKLLDFAKSTVDSMINKNPKFKPILNKYQKGSSLLCPSELNGIKQTFRCEIANKSVLNEAHSDLGLLFAYREESGERIKDVSDKNKVEKIDIHEILYYDDKFKTKLKEECESQSGKFIEL